MQKVNPQGKVKHKFVLGHSDDSLGMGNDDPLANLVFPEVDSKDGQFR